MKTIKLLLCMILMFSLTACSGKYPEQTSEGIAWDKEWEILGTIMGIEPLDYGLELLENPVVLTTDDTFYATYVSGEPEKYINDDQKEVDLYPLQLYILAYGCADEALANEAKLDWMDQERTTFRNVEEETIKIKNIDYTILHYDCKSETNPYARGISAYATYENYTMVIELMSVNEFEDDESAMIQNVLHHIHYAKKEG